jgi:hypothetical protein
LHEPQGDVDILTADLHAMHLPSSIGVQALKYPYVRWTSGPAPNSSYRAGRQPEVSGYIWI